MWQKIGLQHLTQEFLTGAQKIKGFNFIFEPFLTLDFNYARFF